MCKLVISGGVTDWKERSEKPRLHNNEGARSSLKRRGLLTLLHHPRLKSATNSARFGEKTGR